MQKLTNKEEEIMHILWKLKKAFVKEVMSEITEEKEILSEDTVGAGDPNIAQTDQNLSIDNIFQASDYILGQLLEDNDKQ